MKISRLDLAWAADCNVISSEQAETLWQGLEVRHVNRPRLDTAHVAYYFGALLIIGAMGWFMNEGWERFGGIGLTLIAMAYGGGVSLCWPVPMEEADLPSTRRVTLHSHCMHGPFSRIWARTVGRLLATR